jgi:hypothetical protein
MLSKFTNGENSLFPVPFLAKKNMAFLKQI